MKHAKEQLVWHVCIVETCTRKYICDDCRQHAKGEHVCETCREKWTELRRRTGSSHVTVRSRRARKDAQRSRLMRSLR